MSVDESDPLPENVSDKASAEIECVEDEFADNRRLWDWQSKYPLEARSEIKWEARILGTSLVIALLLAGLFLSLASTSNKFEMLSLTMTLQWKFVALFLVGSVGGLTFSIKWLVHAAAKGRWHLDRRYWRLLVPLMGGVYACVVLTLWDAGLFQSSTGTSTPLPTTSALAFLIGYFSDGVSGLLTNIANAVFGTIEKK